MDSSSDLSKLRVQAGKRSRGVGLGSVHSCPPRLPISCDRKVSRITVPVVANAAVRL